MNGGLPNTAKTSFARLSRKAEGEFPASQVELVDSYLAGKGLWTVEKPGEFDWMRLRAVLLQRHKLTFREIDELTLPEAVLYMVDLETKSSNNMADVYEAIARAKIMSKLPVGDYLALAKLRTEGG